MFVHPTMHLYIYIDAYNMHIQTYATVGVHQRITANSRCDQVTSQENDPQCSWNTPRPKMVPLGPWCGGQLHQQVPGKAQHVSPKESWEGPKDSEDPNGTNTRRPTGEKAAAVLNSTAHGSPNHSTMGDKSLGDKAAATELAGSQFCRSASH